MNAAATAAATTATAAQNDILFEHAPPMGVQMRLGLVTADNFYVRRRALLVILAGWGPLVLLSVLQTAWTHTNTITPFLWEVGAHARYLLAAPLLILAEAVCASRLNAIVRHFVDSGIVDKSDHDPFHDAVNSTRRLLASPLAEIAVVALAYLVVLATVLSYEPDHLPLWARPTGITPRYSLAGWWHMLVSLPLMLALILGWFWRLILWTRLLWKISRLKLRLVASHPDHCAGLGFLGHSVRAFAIVAMAIAVIVAGRSAHHVLDGGTLPTPHLYFNIGFLTAIILLFVAPLLVFTAPLSQTWHRAMFEYGSLADQVGRMFERKSLGPDKAEISALGEDFSTTGDLYAIVENVHAMRFIPVELKDVAALVAAILLPFLPVVALAVPPQVIWQQIKSLLL